ncbi:hypothetical protein SE336_16000 [Xanthomonas arboricola]|uniref:hypothetical protein n=2 Tax=Xanthomonas TaxID=338 RepID=UPI0039F5D324
MDPSQLSNQTKPRNYWLEGLLELGRNWALAVVIAGAGLTAFNTETVDGPVAWERWVFYACIWTSIVFMFLAVLRFDEGLTRLLKGKLARSLGFLLYACLVTLGIFIVILVGKFADNQTIVRACEDAKNRPEGRVYKADECVRLRAQRQAVIDRLEGR